MKRRAYDVAVVGAGIVGAACARECARQGLSVVVIEAHHLAYGATSAAMGHLAVMDDSEAQFALTRYSLKLWDELAAELPADSGLDHCGCIWIAADEEDFEQLRRKQAFYQERDVAVEVLDAQALREAEPNLRPGLAGGLLVPGDSVVYPPCAARFLMEQARATGAESLFGQAATSLTGGVRLEDGQTISARFVINAAGAWAPALTPGIEVLRRKGHLVITDRYPGFARHQLIELGYLKSAHAVRTDSVACNIQPRSTGQLLIGSSRQLGVESPEADLAVVRAMIKRASEYMPGLAELNAIRVWTGFRPTTPDNLPLIGPSPNDASVYLATGHEGLGITTSLASARLVADLLLERPSEIPTAPYLPSRTAQEARHA